MGEAARRRAVGLQGARPNPVVVNLGELQRHVLGLIDRRMEPGEDGEMRFSDHSAKPNIYASADLRTLYKWDGTMLRRLDRTTMQPHNTSHS